MQFSTLRAGGKLRGHGNGVSVPEELQKDLSDGMVKSDGFAVCTTEENDVKQWTNEIYSVDLHGSLVNYTR